MDSNILFDPYSPEFSGDPYKVYRQLRQQQPILYHKPWATWIFSRYEDINTLLTDKRLGRTMDHVSTEGEIAAYRQKHHWAEAPAHSKYVKVSILDSEGQLHERLRNAVFREFTAPGVNHLEDGIRQIVNAQLDGISSRSSFDFVEDFVAPIPGLVIGKVLGVPDGECAQLRTWSEDIVQFFEPERTSIQRELAEQSTLDFVAYLSALTEERRRHPREDLISRMIGWRDGTDRLSEDELISTCMTILMAGHGSTIDVAGNGMLALLRHPQQMRDLTEQPSLMKSAIQEMFRYDPPLPYFHRFVLEDMSYKGKQFKKGAMLGFLYASANRDEKQFDEADQFDIRRRPKRHLAFGGGSHHCLGNHLARLNMSLIFQMLLQRFPSMRLGLGADQLQYRVGCSSRGLISLPIEK
jgi:cytochrome P450